MRGVVQNKLINNWTISKQSMKAQSLMKANDVITAFLNPKLQHHKTSGNAGKQTKHRRFEKSMRE